MALVRIINRLVRGMAGHGDGCTGCCAYCQYARASEVEYICTDSSEPGNGDCQKREDYIIRIKKWQCEKSC